MTVVAVLATDKNAKIANGLEELAQEVQKREPTLRGFRKERTISKPVKVGGSETFTLVGKAAMQVTVQANTDRDGRVTLTIKPPNQGEITYACCCGKYFPVITRHVTPDGERLIIAVMAKPCMKK